MNHKYQNKSLGASNHPESTKYIKRLKLKSNATDLDQSDKPNSCLYHAVYINQEASGHQYIKKTFQLNDPQFHIIINKKFVWAGPKFSNILTDIVCRGFMISQGIIDELEIKI